MTSIQAADCQRISDLVIVDWEQFRKKTVIITGATGLIGSNLVNTLAYVNKEKDLEIQIILLVRDVKAAKKMFPWMDVQIVSYTLGDRLDIRGNADYIVHLASPTSSRYFVEKPADTILANIEGTKALLDWARLHAIRKFITLSSMEVYGFPKKGHLVRENELGAFETMNARNSYPLAKLACENLCYAYYSQYGIPTVILRATQTFGPGARYDDNRVFAQFMRCAIENKDIILKSHGLTERSYLYTADAVSAILIALLYGEPGEAYTIANPDTYISIRDMAQLVAEKIAGGAIKVRYDIDDNLTNMGYADVLYMDLDIEKMKSIGWYPMFGLQEMYERMICSCRETKEQR